MLRVHLAELRDSWTVWLGVCITFVMANAALVPPALLTWSGYQATTSGQLDFQSSAEYTAVMPLEMAMICFVAMPVLGAATGMVVDSRRGSLARLALAGATPGQVRRTMNLQLTCVTLACAVLGDVVGLLLTRPYQRLMDVAQAGEQLHQVVQLVWAPAPVLVANLLCVLVALAGGRKHARRASVIPPVEALRQAVAPSGSGRLTAGGWVKVLLLALLVVASYLAVPQLLAHRNKETVSNLVVIGFLQVFFWGALLAVAGPLLVAPVARAWTRLVPGGSATWQLARSTVSGRPERMQRSLAPVMFCVGIAVGQSGYALSMLATFERSGVVATLETPGLSSFLLVTGLPLAVAFAGGVGTLVMMSRQRDAELALVGISGATPAQRVWIPVLEAVIITVTAVVLALGMIVPAYVFQAYALTAAGMRWTLAIPWAMALGTIGACALVTVASTVLPTLPARSRAENRVIARLVAE